MGRVRGSCWSESGGGEGRSVSSAEQLSRWLATLGDVSVRLVGCLVGSDLSFLDGLFSF